MKSVNTMTAALIGASFSAAVFAQADANHRHLRPLLHKPNVSSLAERERDEETGASISSPFSVLNATAQPAAGSVLTPPVSITTTSNADALTATQNGYGRAITGLLNNTGNGVSAIKGQTNSKGAGIHGINIGTTGPAGKFQILNANNGQPTITATTTGYGNAIYAETTASVTPTLIVKNSFVSTKPEDPLPVGIQASAQGYGVYGDGTYYGVLGYSAYTIGTSGQSDSGTGVDAYSTSGIALSAYTQSGTALTAQSVSGLAGQFTGAVKVTGSVTAASFKVSSDRNLKQGFATIDGEGLLDRIGSLPITSWNYKDSPDIRHVGPMAQDFHAAFGLGSDDTHIEVVDIAGVSLAAIQQLQRQTKQKDAAIEDLKAQVAELRQLVETRLAARGPSVVVDAAPIR